MTDNEKKAKEIIRNNHYVENSIPEKMLIKMAKWKDQQFKEHLEKKRGNIYWDETSLIDRNTKLGLLDEIINELFGEAEEIDHSNNDE